MVTPRRYGFPMMKAIIAATVLALPMVQGDGLPLTDDRNGIEARHIFLKIDESQREEIITLDNITLTKNQWAEARKLCAAIPKRIETVFPKDWDDCTCGTEDSAAYVILWNKDTIAVVATYGEVKASHTYSDRLKNSGGSYLSVDERGQFYHDGVLIPFAELLAASQVKAKPNPNETSPPQPSVSVKLPMSLKADAPSLKDRLAKLEETLRANGWDFYTYPRR